MLARRKSLYRRRFRAEVVGRGRSAKKWRSWRPWHPYPRQTRTRVNLGAAANSEGREPWWAFATEDRPPVDTTPTTGARGRRFRALAVGVALLALAAGVAGLLAL